MKKQHAFAIAATALLGSVITAPNAYAQLASGKPTIASYHAKGNCLDVRATDSVVLIWTCHGGDNQAFRFASGSYGQIVLPNGKCLTGGSSSGLPLMARTCASTVHQKWAFQSNGQLNNEAGWCADIEGGGRGAGTRVVSYKCQNSSNQMWYPAVTAKQATLGLQALANVGNRTGTSFISSLGFSMGNLVAAGGGNLVAAGGGNLVAAGGGNVVLGGRGSLVGNDGASLRSAIAGNLVAAGGGNLLPSNMSFFSGSSAGVVVSLPPN